MKKLLSLWLALTLFSFQDVLCVPLPIVPEAASEVLSQSEKYGQNAFLSSDTIPTLDWHDTDRTLAIVNDIISAGGTLVAYNSFDSWLMNEENTIENGVISTTPDSNNRPIGFTNANTSNRFGRVHAGTKPDGTPYGDWLLTADSPDSYLNDNNSGANTEFDGLWSMDYWMYLVPLGAQTNIVSSTVTSNGTDQNGKAEQYIKIQHDKTQSQNTVNTMQIDGNMKKIPAGFYYTVLEYKLPIDSKATGFKLGDKNVTVDDSHKTDNWVGMISSGVNFAGYENAQGSWNHGFNTFDMGLTFDTTGTDDTLYTFDIDNIALYYVPAHTITFDAGQSSTVNGSQTHSVTVGYEIDLSQYTPETNIDGAKFLGWKTSSGVLIEEDRYVVSADETLTAQWKLPLEIPTLDWHDTKTAATVADIINAGGTLVAYDSFDSWLMNEENNIKNGLITTYSSSNTSNRFGRAHDGIKPDGTPYADYLLRTDTVDSYLNDNCSTGTHKGEGHFDLDYWNYLNPIGSVQNVSATVTSAGNDTNGKAEQYLHVQHDKALSAANYINTVRIDGTPRTLPGGFYYTILEYRFPPLLR